MKYLYLDTETTGFIAKGKPLDAKEQPRVVQFAAILADEKGNEFNSCSLVIDPEDIVIPDVVAKIHGITTEFAKAYGVSLKFVFELWESLVAKADAIVAHNSDFDVTMMQISSYQAGSHPIELPKQICTMRGSTQIVNLPPTERMIAAGITEPKSPSLTECMQFFFNEKSCNGGSKMMYDAGS